jgi:ribokinase
MGADVRFMGCVGRDVGGNTVEYELDEAGVDCSHLFKLKSASTAEAGIFLSESGENSIVVCPGANQRLTGKMVAEVMSHQEPDIVVAQLEVPIGAVIEAAKQAERFILNPAPAADIPDELIKLCWAITPNEIEAEQLTGTPVDTEEGCQEAAAELTKRGAKNVIITLGERGCYWFANGRGRIFEAPKVNAIDTTAAGDVFTGVFASRVSYGSTIPDALVRANAAGAMSTTKLGASTSIPHRQQIEEFLSAETAKA